MSLSQALTYYISEIRQSIFRQNLQNPPTRLRRDGSAYGQEKLRVAGNWWRVCSGVSVSAGGRFSVVIDAPLQVWALEYGPDVCEGVGFYGFVEEVLVWKNGLNVQDALDVTDVFFAFAFSVKDHFPEDNVFGWCDMDRAERCLLGESVLPSPCEGGVAIAGVEV